jgi:hypothetical protein
MAVALYRVLVDGAGLHAGAIQFLDGLVEVL